MGFQERITNAYAKSNADEIRKLNAEIATRRQSRAVLDREIKDLEMRRDALLSHVDRTRSQQLSHGGPVLDKILDDVEAA
jgi:cell division protein FtsB